MPSSKPVDVPLFGAEDLRAIERVNAEIARNGRLGRRRPEHPQMTLYGSDAIGFGEGDNAE